MNTILWKKIASFFIIAVLALSSLSCQKLTQQIMYTRARNLHDHGHIEKAVEIYKNLIKANSNNSEVQYDLGVAYVDLHKGPQAQKQVSILRDMNRDDLADILRTVIRDGNSARVRKDLQTQHDADKADD
jgi:tetratricopeptide (TPR) repeat protein